MKKLIALFLALAMLGSLALAEAVTPESDVLEYVGMDFDHVFSAFFAKNADDRTLTELTSAMLLGTTPDGDLILDGISGLTVGQPNDEITYYGASRVEVISNADDSADYNITLRDDVVFSDGHPATIDDVIFTIYVLADPAYNGSINIRNLPIQGLDAYCGTAGKLYDLMIAAGRENTDFTYWDEATQSAFWNELDAVGTAIAQEIIDYILENYLSDDFAAQIGKTAAEIEANAQLQVQFGMAMWGYADQYFDGATAADYWQIILNEYDGDVLLAMETESIGSDFNLSDRIDGFDDQYGQTISVGNPVETIDGIIRTGDYSMTIHATEESDAILHALSNLPIMPLHYYGDANAYDYENASFGFSKGDLSSLHEKDAVPLGCGEYAFVSNENGTITLEANAHYFAGEVEYNRIVMQEAN